MLIRTIQTDTLFSSVYDSRSSMGYAAAEAAASAIRAVLERKETANVIFAAAPSQNEMLESLLRQDLDFSRINAFHMDEYLGLGLDDSASFSCYLTKHLFSRVTFRAVNLIPAKRTPEAACRAYTELLKDNPPDVVCMGIGENGHIAFNDPAVADFQDPVWVKPVQLDAVCRMQQVHDGCFPTLDAVPKIALTLTVPALMQAAHLICTVPGRIKAAAVKAMLTGPIDTACPASILRSHAHAQMFLDTDSASQLL